MTPGVTAVLRGHCTCPRSTAGFCMPITHAHARYGWPPILIQHPSSSLAAATPGQPLHAGYCKCEHTAACIAVHFAACCSLLHSKSPAIIREKGCCDEPLSAARTFKATQQSEHAPDNFQHLTAMGSVISCGQPDSRAATPRHVGDADQLQAIWRTPVTRLWPVSKQYTFSVYSYNYWML